MTTILPSDMKRYHHYSLHFVMTKQRTKKSSSTVYAEEISIFYYFLSCAERLTERDIYADDFTLREGDRATPS